MSKEVSTSLWSKTAPCQGAQREKRCPNIARLYEISEQNGEVFHTFLCPSCQAEYEDWLEKDSRISAHAAGAW